MLTLLQRNIHTVEQRLVLLAPPGATVRSHFDNVHVNDGVHATLMSEMQRLRGGVYHYDGAISDADLSADGRHRTPEDERSWHLLLVGPRRAITACVWYREHQEHVQSGDLRVRNSPLALNPQWSAAFWRAIDGELSYARRHGLRYAEVGGWAVAPQNRCTSEGLVLALAAYSLGRIAGGALGMTTATVRHSSSTILRRIGGSSLRDGEVVIPSYYDPRYRCEMEILRFDSRRPDPKYEPLIEMLEARLTDVLVVAPTSAERERVFVPSSEPARVAA